MKEKIKKLVFYIIILILWGNFGLWLLEILANYLPISTEQLKILATVFFVIPIIILGWNILKLFYFIFCNYFNKLHRTKNFNYLAKIEPFDAFIVFLFILLFIFGVLPYLFTTN
mgnify:FL=1